MVARQASKKNNTKSIDQKDDESPCESISNSSDESETIIVKAKSNESNIVQN